MGSYAYVLPPYQCVWLLIIFLELNEIFIKFVVNITQLHTMPFFYPPISCRKYY